MADKNHLAIVNEGNEAISNWRKDQIGKNSDTPPVLDLRGEKFSGNDLKGKNLANADLTNCEIRNADLTETRFSDALLTNIKISHSTLEKTNFNNARLHCARFFKVKPGDKGENTFHNTELTNTEFSRSKLPRSDFRDGATLVSARFIHSDISDSQIFNSNLEKAQFINCTMSNTEFKKVDFKLATFRHVDFSSIKLDHVDFSGVKTIWKNKNLDRAEEAKDIKSLDNDTLLPWHQKYVTWEMIRKFGELPLFLASYLGLLFIPLAFAFFSGTNQRIEFGREWAERILALPAHPDYILAEAMLRSLDSVSPPVSLYLVLAACLCTAIGSTIYHLMCPDKVKSFSRSQWENDLKHPLIQYSPATWTHPVYRMVSMSAYCLGFCFFFATIVANVFMLF